MGEGRTDPKCVTGVVASDGATTIALRAEGEPQPILNGADRPLERRCLDVLHLQVESGISAGLSRPRRSLR